ncbi:MAG TPA: phosphatidate cytidylyltransferase [Usitatibacter sp.]|nr:phosphatidate cytidylyltransferase [Usitatibacter sp.]
MLRTRVITAVALMPLVLGMLFLANRAVWSAFVLVVVLLACWEWSRMCGLSPRGRSLWLAASGIIGAFAWLMYLGLAPGNFAAASLTAFIIAAAFWVVGAPAWLGKKLRPSPSTCAAAGWIVAWPTWFALVVLRDASPWLLLALAVVVWVADIAAYFAGRRFGKHKLAPAVSPGKTWEGVVGGMVGVALYGLALCAIAERWDTPITPFFAPAGGLPAVLAMLALTAVSIVGDLFESWMKRGAGLKDSSNLLPGHGGVLDRIDALTSSLPVAALLLWVAS